ncbi:MAG: pyridoxal phosphate-dependent aminotransferase family protein [Firmicutes bacterium]|nr:pyridoxal phosphate-dependent aminotransferase family protein [Bacillota bacterium]
MSLFTKCEKFTDATDAQKMGLYPYFHELHSQQDVEVIMEGKRRIMLGSNNYLGLTADEGVKQAAIAAIEKYGSGCSGSRFLNGTLDLHTELERNLARFLRKESALTFSTGFQTNLGIISTICGRNDYIISDKENHASIYDGCMLSYAKHLRFKHSNMEDLERVLASIPEDAGKLIVTDGVFSMSGDICRLPDIIELKNKYKARVLVDDAHGLGVLGEGGRGTASHFGLEDEVDMIMGTFSKSLASLGGYMVASEVVANYIKHKSRPFIFSASIPPACCAAAIKALAILENNPERVDKLAHLAKYMKAALRNRGIKIQDSPTPIIPIYTTDVITTLTVNKRLFEAGVYVNPVLPPAAPANDCLLRLSLMATHTEALLDEAADIIEAVMKEANLA